MNLKNYSKTTQQHIKAIQAELTAKYGEIKPAWNATIELIADNLDLIQQCRESIKLYGIYNPSTGRKNGLLATLKDLQASTLKAFQQLGVTPWSESKIKTDSSSDDDELLKRLMGD